MKLEEWKFIKLLIVGFAAFGLVLMSSSTRANSNADWNYFPTNLSTEPKAERLSLISRGINQNYTPGVYQLKQSGDKEYIELQLWDAPVHEEFQGLNGDVDYVRNGVHTMDIIFENTKEYRCVTSSTEDFPITVESNTLNTQSKDCNGEEIFKRSIRGDNSIGWSLPLRLVPVSQNIPITIHTVWKGKRQGETVSNVPNTFNIFAFRTQHGSITTKETDLTRLLTDDFNAFPYSQFRTSEEKIDYEGSVNWVFPYSITGYGTPRFVFDLYVGDLNTGEELIILDKDADASLLHGGVASPADPGVKMKVSWLKDSQLETIQTYDQKPVEKSDQADYIAGESNSYQGPSWDLNNDENGKESIQWYKFLMPATKPSNTIRVEWYDFQTFSNAFGFAANVPMYGGGDEAADDPEPLTCPSHQQPIDGQCVDKTEPDTSSCSSNPFITLEFKELSTFNEDAEISTEDWKAQHPSSKDPHEYRVYGFKDGASVMPVGNMSANLPLKSSANQNYVELSDYKKISIPLKDIQTNILRDRSTVEDHYVDGTRILSASERDVPGVMITRNIGRVEIPQKVRDRLEREGRNIQYLEENGLQQGLIDYFGLQMVGRGTTQLKSFADIRIGFPCSEGNRSSFGFQDVSGSSFESNGKSNSLPSSCDYEDGSTVKNLTRFKDDLWEKSTATDFYKGCNGRFKDNQILKIDRTADDLSDHTVQILQTLSTNTETTIIPYGCIRGSEGDGECKENTAPEDYLLELHAKPISESDVSSGEKIAYTLRFKNIGERELSNVKLQLEAPTLTSEDGDQVNNYELNTVAPQDTDEDPIDKILEVIVDADLDDQTIFTNGKFYMTADEYGEEKKYPNLVCHYIGEGDETLGKTCVCNGDGCDASIKPEPISKCEESDDMRACIESTPAHNSYGLDPNDATKNIITYHIEVTNLSTEDSPKQLSDLKLSFENPLHTSLISAQLAEVSSDSGSYTGKGVGSFNLASTLDAGASLTKDVSIVIDTDSGLTDFDISSKDKLTVNASNNSSVKLPEQLHHVGEGAINVTVSRCYAYDYVQGDFECSQSCDTIEPGTTIMVRDLLTNNGGESALDHIYYPTPLADSLIYQEGSLYINGTGEATGIAAANDGASFPPSGGVKIPGSIAASGGTAAVYFQYQVPEDASGCLPTEVSEPTPPDGQSSFSDITYELDCGDDTGKICVGTKPNPVLTATLSAVPTPDKDVYQGTVIQYTLQLKNTTKQPVANLTISAADVALTTCHNSTCTEITETNPGGLEDNFGEYFYSYSLKVDDDAIGNKIVNPGHSITYSGIGGSNFSITSNSVEHDLKAEAVPTGSFFHDINLTRRIVLNSADGSTARASTGNSPDNGDETIIEHEFEYEGTGNEVLPFLTSGQQLPTNYQYDYCSRDVGYGYRGSPQTYEASPGSSVRIYQSDQSVGQPISFNSLRSESVSFSITSQLPDTRPEMINSAGANPDVINYTISPGPIVEDGINAINFFMKEGGRLLKTNGYTLRSENGRTISSSALARSSIRAIKDGNGGEIETTNRSEPIREDIWTYQESGRRNQRVTCSKPCGRFTCYSSFNPPEFRWFYSGASSTPILEASDKDYISVLTSVAWLKTKNGHVGIGTPFWSGSGDPNAVDLGDAVVNSQMKFYTPPNEFNSDMLIYSHSGNDPLKSRLQGSSRIASQGIKQGYITDKLSGESKINLSHNHQLSRGEAYDREQFPRDYYDDLLNRQLYGEVIRLNNDLSQLSGLSGSDGNYRLSGGSTYEVDKIYYLKGNLSIGNPAAPGENSYSISGGKARLFVEGSVTIYDNVQYSSHSGSDLATIPSLRLHSTGNISIHQLVTDIELMMLAENEFHSGNGDEQLRILGDVITYKAFWERTPLNKERDEDEEVNKPSELIYEDYRKYILTPPGDKKLPDIGNVWREVNPSTGRPILEPLWATEE